MKKVLVLGATGSIGTSGLDIIANNKDLFCAVGMSAHSISNTKKLQQLAKAHNCKNLCISATTYKQEILQCQDTSTDAPKINFFGENGLKELIEQSDCDIVLNGIAGAAGLMPSVWAIQNKKDLALANKETIVMAGNLIKKLATQNGVQILPVDSEHSAVFNLIQKYGKESVQEIILTASGGPFKNLPKEKLKNVTLADTLKHPTWNMGKKITIDSATLANKGLEVIEACRLFDIDVEKVRVVVHPQSLVHSLIRTKDGVLYAQISHPDMRHPILSALSYPKFLPNALPVFDLANDVTMTFSKPRFEDFPMLSLAIDAVKKAGGYTIAYNGANEVAVGAFLKEKINFTDIALITKTVLQEDWSKEPDTIEEVCTIDKLAREKAQSALQNILQRGAQ